MHYTEGSKKKLVKLGCSTLRGFEGHKALGVHDKLRAVSLFCFCRVAMFIGRGRSKDGTIYAILSTSSETL